MVRDQTGASISGAEVSLQAGKYHTAQRTDASGGFTFNLPSDLSSGESTVITVQASGFRSQQRTLNGSEIGATVEIVLGPASVFETTTVVATRTEVLIGDAGASVRVLSQSDLSSTGALTLDNVLGQVPGFNLFRRSSSRTSNPTSQGVSFRGTGGSGASRAVVLYDGVPLEDPFGGWVYWSRVPYESISRIEVLGGAASDLYGSNALGGAVNIVRRQLTDSAIFLESSYGNERSPDTNLIASGRWRNWLASAEGEVMSTDGYVLVNRNQRGLVDVPATSEHRMGAVSLERLFSNHSRLFFRGSNFGEQRGNGTPLQTNSTIIRQLSLGADWESSTAGNFSLRAYGGPQKFNQGFSSVAADRNSESLTNLQTVPTEQTGVSAQWSRALTPWQVLLAGAEGRDIHGDTRETVFSSGKILRTTDAGGHQRIAGFFVEDMLSIKKRWLFTLAGRFDSWRNFDALSRIATTVNNLRSSDETAFSPRLSGLYKLSNNVSLYAAGYRSFRAPTLNELYRAFRVGNVVTQANEHLKAEHVTGTEAGAKVNFFNQKLVVGGVFFWNQISRPVANVTLTTTPALITRQRQNLGSTESKGFELESEARITSALSLAAGYQFADATVASFPANTALESLHVPQVPRQQFTFQGRYVRSRYTVSFQGRAVGTQFDDDQNLLPLAPYFSLDGFISRSFPHGAEVFVAAENLLNQRAQVSRTPVITLGPPALVRIGVRLHLGKEQNTATKH